MVIRGNNCCTQHSNEEAENSFYFSFGEQQWRHPDGR